MDFEYYCSTVDGESEEICKVNGREVSPGLYDRLYEEYYNSDIKNFDEYAERLIDEEEEEWDEEYINHDEAQDDIVQDYLEEILQVMPCPECIREKLQGLYSLAYELGYSDAVDDICEECTVTEE